MPYPDTLLFLGAGASAPFGVPVMKRMVAELETDRMLLTESERSTLTQLSSVLKELYGEDYDLEKLLDVVHDLSDAAGIDPTLRALAPRALYRFRDVMMRTGGSRDRIISESDQQFIGSGRRYQELERAITEQIAKWCYELEAQKARVAYRDLLTGLCDSPLTDGLDQRAPTSRLPSGGREGDIAQVFIATTNYDEAVEMTLAALEVTLETGFSLERSRKVLRFNSSSKFDNGQEMSLAKLHGSVNWWRTTSGDVVRLELGKVGHTLLDGSKLQRREIRYPVATKNLGGLPYASLYTRFAEALQAARVWLVIGYSFGDPSIVQLFEELWTSEKRLYILGPNSRGPAKRQLPAKLRDNAFYVDFKFGDNGVIDALKRAEPFDQTHRV